MKILNIICKQNIGGVGQVFLDYGHSLMKQDNEVAIVISKNDKLNADYSNFAKVYKLKNLSPVLDSIKLFLIIKRYKPDVVICHNPRSIRLACNLKKLMKVPVVAVNHGWSYQHSLRCDYIFNVNEPIRQKTIEAGFNELKTMTVLNMVDIESTSHTKKAKFHIPIRIGIIGRIEYGKGFDLFVKALSILKKKKIDFIGKIGGFSADKEIFLKKLQESIKEEGLTNQVEFLGKIIDKKSFYKGIDILIVPSRHEALPLVILEGFKYSTPIISSETDGAKVLIQNNENGLIFPIGDYEELSKRIEFLIKHPDFANKLAENGFKTVKEKYSFESVGEDINKKLRKIVKQFNEQ